MVSFADFESNGICQNPEFASRFEKLWLQLIGQGLVPLPEEDAIFSLRSGRVRSTQMRTCPFCSQRDHASATIRWFVYWRYHSKDIFSLPFNSSVTGLSNGIRTLRGVVNANGFAPSCRVIV